MKKYLFVLGCLLCSFWVKGQAPVGNFTASTVSGCAPLVVTFKDLSTGNPKFWNWDLGNGQLSNIQNPTAVYTTPGTYTVTLVVRNADGTNGITKTDYITVNQSPHGDFTSDLTLTCLPATIQFTDLSFAHTGNLTSWEWDFGDGTRSSVRNPAKTYASTGFYTVSLRVTSSSGCQAVVAKSRYIRIVPGVTARFADSIPAVCRPPASVRFTNESSGPGSLSYAWDFGNGSSSTQDDPVATFAGAGNFSVRMIARSSFGCSDTTEEVITIRNKTTGFTAPDSACIGQSVSLVNQSTEPPLRSEWAFGDGTSSQLINPSKVFAAPGSYAIQLRNIYNDCVDSAIKSIQVLPPPAADFNANQTGSCKAPFTVQFNDLTADAVAWQWDFGDGATSTVRNPSHTYTSTGEFDVTLTVRSAFGCSNTISKTKFIRIVAPSVTIANVPAEGCIPYTFVPSPVVNAVDAVTSYAWNFGDGNTSTAANPSHSYANVGTYTVSLSVTTAGGCSTAVSYPGGVRTGTPPSVNFTPAVTQACAFDSIAFSDFSAPADKWSWNFGDGKTSTLRNPRHAYDTSGLFDVALTAFNNGCPVTVIKPALITIHPPVAKFSFTTDCNTRLSVTFKNESVIDASKPVTYLWEFGDPAATTSAAASPVFTYPSLGRYTVKLTVTNGSCSNTISDEVLLVSDIADFSASKNRICKGEPVTLSAVNSNPANITQYLWSVNAGPSFAAPRDLQTSFADAGIYDITLAITDINGCVYTKSVASFLTVTGPVANFNVARPGDCRNAVITFNDLSTSAAGITRWTFDFGDGTTQSFTAPPFTHIYKDTGLFTVKLTVLDRDGCQHAFTQPNPVAITAPMARFAAARLHCPGAPLPFTDSSSGRSLIYLWNFGDGNVSTDQNPVHVYPAGDRSYTVSLKVTDWVGCADSARVVNYVSVKSPKAAFDIRDTASICPPLDTKFFLKAADYESFTWDFGDGSTPTFADPVHFYNTPGAYRPTLYVTGFGGCVDSVSRNVTIYDAQASSTISMNPLDACNALTVDFTITTPPQTRFTVVFGDGGSDTSQRKSFSHFFGTPSYYQPYMIVRDSLQCEVLVGSPDVIRVIGAEPFFSLDRKNFCDSGTVYFTNYTIGNDPVVSDTWDFGDGQTSSDRDPIHTYRQPGLYVVSHSVTTQSGCAKTITDTVRVYRTPMPEIVSNDLVCLGTPLAFQGALPVADTAIRWSWNFGNGSSSDKQNNSLTYAGTGTYTVSVEATNLLGCKAADNKTITVAPLPVVTVPENPVIVLGSGVRLPVTYSPNVASYNWTPSSTLDCPTCPTPLATPSLNTTYKVDVTDSNNCRSNGQVRVTVMCTNNNYFLPNTFSPNGDGINDIFYPRGSGIDRIQSMRIFNRWGDLVFEKKNIAVNSVADGWNGTYKGKTANSDVYVYVIELVCENAAVITQKGNVTLIR